MNLLRGAFFGGARLSGHYFLTDRLTTLGTAGVSNGSYQSGFFRNDSNDFSFNSFGYGLGLGSRYYLTTARHFGWLAQLDAGWNHRVALEAGPQVQRLLFDEGGAQWLLGLNVGVQFLL